MTLSQNKGQGARQQIRAASKAIDEAVHAQRHEQCYKSMKRMARDLKRHLAKAIRLKAALRKRVARLANTAKFCALQWFRALTLDNADICGERRKAAAEKGQLLTVAKYSQM